MPGSGPAGDAFFAVDVGASWVKSGTVVDGRAGEISREPVARGLDELVRQLVRLHRDGGSPPWGLCVAGLVDRSRGLLRYSANLGLRDAPLVELLAAETEAPVVFANDLDAAAVGEAAGGTLALLQVGTGIAGRFVVAGEIPPSATGLAGEVGHLRFREHGLRCRCGRDGCAEAYGSWAGIERRYEDAGGNGRSPPRCSRTPRPTTGPAACSQTRSTRSASRPPRSWPSPIPGRCESEAASAPPGAKRCSPRSELRSTSAFCPRSLPRRGSKAQRSATPPPWPGWRGSPARSPKPVPVRSAR